MNSEYLFFLVCHVKARLLFVQAELRHDENLANLPTKIAEDFEDPNKKKGTKLHTNKSNTDSVA